MRPRIRRLVAWTLAAAWACAIFLVSARPGSTLPGGYSVQGHLGEYAVFGALLTWALADEDNSLSGVVLAIVLASLYGVTDEFHQHFVAMRTPDVVDWVLDTIGAVAGAFAARMLLVRLARKSIRPEQRATS